MNKELADKTEAYLKKAWKNFGGPNAKEENFCRDIIENMVLFWDMWTLKQNTQIKSVDDLYYYYQSKWDFDPVKFDDVYPFLNDDPAKWKELVELAAEYSSEELKNIILNFKPFPEANIEKVPSGIKILAEELLEINEEGVREEGIIKGGKFCVKTNKFNLSSIDSFFDDKTVEQQIAVWAGKVSEYYLFLNLKKV